MEYNVEYDQENDILIARYQGVLEIESLINLAKVITKKGQEHDCKRLLNDFRHASIEVDTMELFNVADQLKSEGFDRKWKRATVIAEQYRGHLRFYETVAFNRGHRVRVVTELDEAINWLKSEKDD